MNLDLVLSFSSQCKEENKEFCNIVNDTNFLEIKMLTGRVLKGKCCLKVDFFTELINNAILFQTYSTRH